MNWNAHNSSSDQVDPMRLISAADALLEVEAQSPNGLGSIVAGNPKSDQFTPHELVEAMTFLIRAGLVVPNDNNRDQQVRGHRRGR